jgi:hypothetical protein
MGGSTNSCCSKDKAVEGSKGENFAPMDRERKSLFKKKKVNRSDIIDGLSSSGAQSRAGSSNKISSNMTRQTLEMQNNVYGPDRPQIFDTINYINTLIENSRQSWTAEVSKSFNGSIQKKIKDKEYWRGLTYEHQKLNDLTKEEVGNDLHQLI